MPTALILRALGLGDFIAGTPALRLVREVLPGHRLVLAGPAHFGELAVEAGLVDAVLDTHDLKPLRPCPAELDVAIDLHGNGPASRTVLLACHPGRLVAFTTDPRQWSGPLWDPREHEVHRWCRLIGESFGVSPALAPPVAGVLPRLPLPSALPADVTIVHPGAQFAARRWPADRFGTVAAALREAGHEVVVTGSAGERELAESVARRSGTAPLVETTFRELLALVAHARLVVSGDTGVAHVASAYRTPSVVLFGPVAPAQWGPPEDPIHAPLFAPGTDFGVGDPHGDTTDPALLQIGVEEVLQACRRVLAAAGRAGVDAHCGVGGDAR